MEQLFALLEDMLKKKVIGGYAVGGATALVFYFEPVNTQDVDVFVLLDQEAGPFVTLTPIYEFLSSKGYKADKEYIMIGSIPVQFLVPYNELLMEAIRRSKKVSYGKQKFRIIRLEYLMAIMVQTGRLKDKARLEALFETKIKFDSRLFDALLKKYSLGSEFKKISREFKK